jgi:hypothetical protein
MYYLHIQDGRVSHTSNHQEEGRQQRALLVSCFAYSPAQKLVAIFLRDVGLFPKSVSPTCLQRRPIYYAKQWFQIPHIMAVQLPNTDTPLPTHKAALYRFCVHCTPHKQLRVRVTLRLAVYRQSIRLRAKPLETHDQYFFN